MSRPPCLECGAPSEHDHHVVPRSRGGTVTVPLCVGCHSKAHHREGNMATSALTRAAMARKQKRGEYTGGYVPYGWTLADDGVKLLANEAEQTVMTYAHELRSAGLSLRAVGVRLAEKGMTPKRGAKWHAQSVKALLAASRAKNGPYCGAEMDKQFLGLQ